MNAKINLYCNSYNILKIIYIILDSLRPITNNKIYMLIVYAYPEQHVKHFMAFTNIIIILMMTYLSKPVYFFSKIDCD